MNDKKTDSIVEGFVFHSEKMAETAAKEREGIKYIRNKTDMENAEMVLQIYDKIIDQRLFETPIGIGFLKELQDYLRMTPYIDDEVIRPIDMDDFIHQDEFHPDTIEAKGKRLKKEAPRPKEKVNAKSLNNTKIKNHLRLSRVVNIILALMVVAMFAIAMTSSTPNIINYENNLLDKYAGWEQDLTEREQQIRLKERELNITP